MQLIIVIIALILCILYAAFCLYKAFTNKSGKCYGCHMNEVCNKKWDKSRGKELPLNR